MYIKCWGSRGSIPVSGRQYLKYGGDTTCLEIRTNSNDLIIVDAGTGIRRLGNQLIKEDRHVFNFIFTHSHWDHLMGFPFFKPLYRKESEILMHRCPFPGKYVESIVTKLMRPPHFPVRYSDLTATVIYRKGCPEAFDIGSVRITPIPLSHPNGGCGYRFEEDGKVFIFLTDNELGYIHPGGLRFYNYISICKEADLLIHDAEYLPEEYKSSIEWGHSTYTDALKLALEADVKSLGLFHLNQERTDEEVDEMVGHCRRLIEDEGRDLECFAVGADTVMEV
ncbi:MAG: MBL fold metallo-hydrolase [Deltaproteobacteria bacterium]|nr:MBL fold metallo-hydrolase [Deltaproteobacteria bacterium]